MGTMLSSSARVGLAVILTVVVLWAAVGVGFWFWSNSPAGLAARAGSCAPSENSGPLAMRMGCGGVRVPPPTIEP